LAIYDTDGGYWLQPGFHWEIDGSHMRFDLFANSLEARTIRQEGLDVLVRFIGQTGSLLDLPTGSK